MKTKIDGTTVLGELMKASWDTIEAFGRCENLRETNLSKVNNELMVASEKVDASCNKVYVFSDGQKKEISNELVKNNQECLLNVNMIDRDSRNDKNEVEIDFKLKYLDEIIKYMNNEFDICELNDLELNEFCRELMEMNILFRIDIMKRLYNSSNEYGFRWKNRCVVVKGNEYRSILDYLKLKLGDMKYDEERERIEFVIDGKYESIIQSFSKFIEDENSDHNKLVEDLDRRIVNEFVNGGILDMNNEDAQSFFGPIHSPFLKDTLLFGNEYDSYLREWTGNYDWRLIYRASEHEYSARSFHECCDNKGPTLIVIKSSEGWLFGGYTSQIWLGECI